MRKAFTLLELLLTMGIMGMLGVAAAAGYGALTRGMQDRSACAGASGLLRIAQERAAVDRMPTCVYCYNICTRSANPDADEEAIVQGVLIGVRRAGRITYMTGSGKGQLLYDEFGDLSRCYDATDDLGELAKNEIGRRLYHFSGDETAMRYSVVADDVYESDDKISLTLFGGDCIGGTTNLLAAAFYNLGTAGNREPQWKVGDGYGMEIGEIRLPPGYIFGKQIPSTAGEIKDIKAFLFKPPTGDGGTSSETIEIYSTQPNARGVPQINKKAGEAKADASEAV